MRWAAGKHDDDYQEPWPEFNRRCVAALDAAAAPDRRRHQEEPKERAHAPMVPRAGGGGAA